MSLLRCAESPVVSLIAKLPKVLRWNENRRIVQISIPCFQHKDGYVGILRNACR